MADNSYKPPGEEKTSTKEDVSSALGWTDPLGLFGWGGVSDAEKARREQIRRSKEFNTLADRFYSGNENLRGSTYTGNVDERNLDGSFKMSALQRGVLKNMMDRTRGGFGSQERADLRSQQLRNARNARSSREALMGQARARGALNSGNTLAAALQGQEAATERNMLGGLNAAAMASDRSSQALDTLANYDAAERARKFQEQLALADAQVATRSGGAIARQGANQTFNQQAFDREEKKKAGLGSLLGGLLGL